MPITDSSDSLASKTSPVPKTVSKSPSKVDQSLPSFAIRNGLNVKLSKEMVNSSNDVKSVEGQFSNLNLKKRASAALKSTTAHSAQPVEGSFSKLNQKQDAEFQLLESLDLTENGTITSGHELDTCPIITREAFNLCQKKLPQYGLLGQVVSQVTDEESRRLDDTRMYFNTNTPSSTIVCGVQGNVKVN